MSDDDDAIYADPGSFVDGVFYSLSGLYFLVAVWCFVKIGQLLSASDIWTTQKSVHILVCIAALTRGFFFVFILQEREDSQYFFVQLTGEYASTWLYIADEAPSLILLVMMGLIVDVWARSFHDAHHNTAWYLSQLRPTALILLGILATGQTAIWICYAYLHSGKVADDLSIAEGSMYAFASTAVAVVSLIYGCGSADVSTTVVASGMTVRLKAERRMRFMAAGCSIAFALRAMTSLVAAIAAGSDFNNFSDIVSNTGIAVGTLIIFLLLELLPLAVLLRMNGRVTGGRKGVRCQTCLFCCSAISLSSSSSSSASSSHYVHKMSLARELLTPGYGSLMAPINRDDSKVFPIAISSGNGGAYVPIDETEGGDDEHAAQTPLL